MSIPSTISPIFPKAHTTTQTKHTCSGSRGYPFPRWIPWKKPQKQTLGLFSPTPSVLNSPIWLFVLCLGVALLYSTAFEVKPILDDLWNLENARDHGMDPFFFHDHRNFRPFERWINGVNVHFFGMRPLLSIFVNVAGLLFSTMLVFLLARRWWPQQVGIPLLAATLFALHPVNVSSTFQVDVISQQYSTFFALATLAWYTLAWGKNGFLYHIIGFFLLGMLVFAKESSAGVALAMPFVVLAMGLWIAREDFSTARNHFIIACAGFILLYGLYLLIRTSLGASVSAGGNPVYGFQLNPLTIGKNFLILLGGLSFMGSSLDYLVYHRPLSLAVSATLSLLLMGLVLLGFRRWIGRCWNWRRMAQNDLFFLMALFCFLATFIPVIFLKHVSELYDTLSSPFYALLLAYLLGERKSPEPPYGWKSILLLGIILLPWLGLSLRDKLVTVRTTSTQVHAYADMLHTWVGQTHHAGDPEIFCFSGDLTNPTVGKQAHSVYSIQTHTALANAVWVGSWRSSNAWIFVEREDPRCLKPFRLVENQLLPPLAETIAPNMRKDGL